MLGRFVGCVGGFERLRGGITNVGTQSAHFRFVIRPNLRCKSASFCRNVIDRRKSVSGKTFSGQVILVQLFRAGGIHSSTLTFRSVRLSLVSGLITDMTLSL